MRISIRFGPGYMLGYNSRYDPSKIDPAFIKFNPKIIIATDISARGLQKSSGMI